MKFLIMFFALQAHAGLFDQLSESNADRSRAAAAAYHAERDRYIEFVTRDWLIRNLNLPSDTSVIYEGRTKGIGYMHQYNVGGTWGCAVQMGGVILAHVACLSRLGQHKSFGIGPIATASDQFYCLMYPDFCPKKARRKRRD